MNIGEMMQQAEQYHWASDEVEAEEERLRALEQLLENEIRNDCYLNL